ncbi:K02A2.6-like [Cordylochernes scorpioides]|uniref:K02A2.6-like n=1 Tax=Cordylochernes scorpioides TaxID=51811 RepID=A0ABY6LE98_9ARAC|nr:K02A2.6-like [Cordylochernes scorpioides]
MGKNFKSIDHVGCGPPPRFPRMCGTSLKTINNIIHKDLELDTRRKGKVHKLTTFHMKNRATNARKLYEEHLAGSRSEYTATLDEAWMYVMYCNGIRKICYIKRGNQVPDNWVHQCSETFPKGFMVVGVMTGRGVLPLIKVPSKVKVNSEFYIECVLKLVIEQLKDLYPGEMDKVFLHHDKASSHTSNKTQQFLQEMKDTLGLNFIRNSDIPVKSPDASPLDFYGFGMLKRRLFNRRPKTEAGLWKAAQEEWSNVSLSKVKEVMGMVQKQGNWVPYELKPGNIERRICTCELLLKRQNRKGFLHRIVTGDEKWIHYDNPKRRKSWNKPGHASTSTAKPNIHGKKLMLCIWWDQLGVIYYELLQPNETITGERYQQQLMRLSRALKIKRPLYAKRHDKVIYQHDNARPHVAKLSRRLWRRFNGMSYPTRRIHQILLLQTTTFPPRRIPTSLGAEVQSELEKMVKQGIVTKIYHETEWSHPMVVVKKKSGQIRICLDPRKLNEALVGRHFQTPAPAKLLHEIPKAKYYTVLDVKSAYWHIPVAKECRDLLVMITPFGKFRYNRLPFGLKISAQIFVEKMTNIFRDSFQNITYVDDLLIYADTIQEHNKKLKGILEKAKEKNIKFDLTKAQICLTKVRFLGHLISQNGIDPEPNKIDKLITFKRPEDKKSLQRIMGLYNYLGKFIPNLAASTSNIRGILRKNVVWHWGPKQDGEFDHIKECVRNAPSLAHFDKSKMLILQCDASKDAMGAALLQEDRPLAFASASFSDSQKQYSQIEKELLSVYYGCKKFEYLLS